MEEDEGGMTSQPRKKKWVRSQNPGGSTVKQMIERAIEANMEQCRAQLGAQLAAQMDAMLAQHREIIAQVIEQHRAQMDAMLAQYRENIAQMTEQMATRMEALEAQICVLENSRHVSSEPEVTSVRAPHDLGSPAHVIVRSSVDSQSDDISVDANDAYNEAQQWTPAGKKLRLSK